MKSVLSFLIPCSMVLLLISACRSEELTGSGNILTESREVSGFDGVILSGFGDVNIQQGDEETLSVSTDDNLLLHIRTVVRNNTLILDFDDKGQNLSYNPTSGIRFSLVLKDLKKIELSGSGSIEIDQLQTDELLAELSGAGSLTIDSLTAKELLVHQSGAGNMSFAGQVNQQEVTHSGIGIYHAADLVSRSTTLKVSGAGSAVVRAIETLEVEIPGPGKVIYYGSPNVVKNVSGLGRLISAQFVDERDVPMMYIPHGPFEMGSYDGDDDEQPVHTVWLDAYYIDQYEVTNGQYALCEIEEACDPTTDTSAYDSSYSRGSYYGNPEYVKYPLINVNWFEAQKYCEWRGGRLPTEAEWEKAARGGLKGKTYPWGDESPVCEVGAENGAKFDDDDVCDNSDTKRIGSYGSNGYELYDMAGNVWEWTSDFYDENYYASSPVNNPTGPEGGGYPVVRGGSWDNNSFHMRISNRLFNDPKSGSFRIGFRCVRTDTSSIPFTPEGSKQLNVPFRSIVISQ